MSSARAFLAMVAIDRFDVLEELAGYDAARQQPVLHRSSVALRFAAEDTVTAEAAMAALATTLHRIEEIEGYRFELAVTIGVAVAGRSSTPELDSIAARAVVAARRQRLRVVVDSSAEAPAAHDRLALMRALQHAIRDDALELYYQPKVRGRTGDVAAAEALLRWKHPELGFVPPDQFIPLAERTGDIAALTEWVVGRTIADQARLLRGGHALPIDINVSSSELGDPGFGWRLLHHFTAVQGQIGFEITETAMIAEPEHALANLQTFAEAGIRLAIDDYGSGFSSLSYLQQLPITELKIDKMFVQRLTSGHRDPLLIRSTIDLAHALEMEVTAEGVETATTLALLQVMGCDMVQGYYLARPLPLDQLTDYLGDHAARHAQVSPAGTVLPFGERRLKRA